ncbi:MAG TPA: DUF2171 domain-containing protein [Sphingomicrobium sp.]|nr:DUF2171 domain-containing protein [Sphingomicrobium sp.]
MAYDRYDNRSGGRDDPRRERGYRGGEQGGPDNDDRGFFERARDEVQSWFGDEDSDDPRSQGDRMSQGRQSAGRENDRFGYSDRSSNYSGGQSTSYGRGRDAGEYRNQYGRGGGESGGFGGGDYRSQGTRYPSSYGQTGGGSYQAPRGRGQEYGSSGRDDDDRGYGRGNFGNDCGGVSSGGRDRDQDDYRPMTGDYGRGGGQGSQGSGMGAQDFNRSQYGRQEFSQDQDSDRSGSQRYNYGGWGDDDSRRQQGGGMMGRAAAAGAAAFGGGRSSTPHDEHYSSWRQRQIDELDRDYDDYRREHQSKFENEFSGWRQQKQTKRQMLNAIREHNEVVDENGEHIGTVDKVRGDKIILTKNDPEAGGVHRSFTCTLLERVEEGKIYLTGSKDSIRSRLTEEREDDGGRSSGGGILGGLFGGGRDRDEDRREEMREQQRSTSSSDDGPHMLDRSFSGTYDDDDKNRK